MDDTDPIYNIQFVDKLRNVDDDIYEKMKIMNRVDKAVSGEIPFILLHVVPALYFLTFLIGSYVFIYKIII